MTLYKNLGPICFYEQTEIYQIFQTVQQSYVLQIKPYISNNLSHLNLQDLLKKQINAYSEGLPLSMNACVYKEKEKPSSIILSHCIPFNFSRLEINQICKIIQAMEKTVLNWENTRIGQINKNLFFISQDKTVFFSLPLKQKTKDQTPLMNQIINFIESISRPNQSSHSLLLKKIKSSSNLENLFEQAKYFSNIYNLKVSHYILPSQRYQNNAKNLKTKLSLHSNSQSSKRSRRKFAIFNQTNSQNNFKSNNFFEQNQQFYDSSNSGFGYQKRQNSLMKSYDDSRGFRNSSKALHLSSTNFSQSLWKKKSSHQHYKKPIRVSQHNLLFSMKNNNLQHSYQNKIIKDKKISNNSKDTFNNSSTIAVSKMISEGKSLQTSQMPYQYNFKNNHKQNFNKKHEKRLSCRKITQQSRVSKKSLKNQNVYDDYKNKSNLMKDIINKSLEKWKKNREQVKIVIQNVGNKDTLKDNRQSKDTKQKQTKKKLKKVGCHPSSIQAFTQLEVEEIKQTAKQQNNKLIQQKNQKSKLKPHSKQRSKQKQKSVKIESKVSQIEIQISQVQQEQISQFNTNFTFGSNTSQTIQNSKLSQNLQQEKKSNKQQQSNKLSQKEKQKEKDKKSTKKISRQMMPKLPNTSTAQGLSTVKNSLKETPRNRQQKTVEDQNASKTLTKSKRKVKTIEQRLKDRLQVLNLVGQCVSNTRNYLGKKDSKQCFWQLPCFLLYRQFLIQRTQIQQQGFDQISEQNKQIQTSLQNLLKQAMKKMKKIQKQVNKQQYQNQMLSCDLTINDKQYYNYMMRGYIRSMRDYSQQNSNILCHSIEFVDAYLILERVQFNFKKHQQMLKIKGNKAIQYLNERIKIVQLHMKSNKNTK